MLVPRNSVEGLSEIQCQLISFCIYVLHTKEAGHLYNRKTFSPNYKSSWGRELYTYNDNIHTKNTHILLLDESTILRQYISNSSLCSST